MVREPAKELIELEVARLDAMLENLQAAIEKGCTKSVNSALKISERRAALLGLDINAANDSADKKTGKEFDSDFLSLMGRIANSLEQ